ncbi:unnamed protein product [Arabis nemorensis]|uniref:Cyclin C-terminal domain-containing protein n=1 Tax=Arabis nemorensis TaxID=586526 RepID=A0A565BUJ6_9BRAS|nr:unnamed protein product [Arabis nemorensis]
MVPFTRSFLINNTDLNLPLTHLVIADASFTAFKPSVVSTAAVLTAIADLHPKLIPLFPIFVKALKGINKELLRPCFIMVVEMYKKRALLSRLSIRHKRWLIEPTKGPLIKISLKWSVGLDIHHFSGR